MKNFTQRLAQKVCLFITNIEKLASRLAQKVNFFATDPKNKNKKIFKTASIILSIEIVLFGVLFLVPETAFSQINTNQLVQMTNLERAKYNLPDLIYNQKLAKAANNKALDILSKGYFAHTTPDGKVFSSWIKEAGYDYIYVGENLAIGFATNEGTVSAWMASGKHRENILGKQYQEIGFAVVNGYFNDKETTVVVQLFGTQRMTDR